jgi:hypothetical protein
MDMENAEIEIKEILDKIKDGSVSLGELGEIFGKIGQAIQKLNVQEKELSSEIERTKEELREQEYRLKKIREQKRDLGVMLENVRESIMGLMGLQVKSKVTGSPVRATGGGKGQKVFVKVTETGVKAGLVNVQGEFESMARAIWAIMPSLEGRRIDFKRKLLSMRDKGYIELEFY